MLMSPMSVAQYIDPDAEKFDLIVFDEASQMPTYEAVGAIARGKNVVVVGDPRQMPPTSFFATNTVDEDHIEIEDQESILDDCLALSMPSKYLLWHYRSKHESLIAFSNSEYYENKLLTFPSPDNIESKVSLVRVDGCYDKGKTRQNRKEAEAVVSEIVRRLIDKELRKRSIGVVTFSSVQQTLIEDMLNALYVSRPYLEQLALENEEPIFIKNLENVQGDERDVILFSVGYGPDANGHVSMNFGPLNRIGGERRLNVAVSRARYEMIIYSTLRSDQIDLNRSSAVGVAGLKRFLEYAEKRENPVLSRANRHAARSMAEIIAQKLKDHGYQVDTNVGCSGYRIDLGIVDKRQPSNYILGILCDGENYRQTKTARDREIVQNSVLKMLGWNIHRVWTMDWWEKPEEVLVAIEEAIKMAEQGIEDIPEATSITPDHTPTQPNEVEAISLQEAPIQSLDINTLESRAEKQGYAREYTAAILPPAKFFPEDFMYPGYKQYVMGQITEVINAEAPISRQLLCKRVLSAWGIARLGQRLDAHFESLFKMMPFHKVVHEGIACFWQSKEQMDNYSIFRPNSGRDATDLPPEEVANGIKQVLEEQISLPTSDLARLTGQLFGYARMGTNVGTAMNRGIKVAVAKGYIKVENGRAKIV
jgi:very-short-patch-repair endonuclease